MILENSQLPTPNSQELLSWRLGVGSWLLHVGSRELSAALVIVCAALCGCGKKGPPLAPIVHVPAAVDKLTARRVGNDVYITFTIPAKNIDASEPADVSRIDVYGATSLTSPPIARIFELATRVASIDVQPPPRPEKSGPPQPPADSTLPAQGTTVTVRDVLTPEALVPKTLPAAAGRGTSAVASAEPPAGGLPRRYYVAVAASDRGRTGPPGMLLEVPLLPLPDAPQGVSLSNTEDAISLSWEPSGGVLGFLFETPVRPEVPPVDEPPAKSAAPASPAAPSGPTLYNVYREAPTDAAATSSATSGNAVPPEPLNASPLAQLSFTDPDPFEFGRERCYVVRAVRGSGSNAVVGMASPRGCITPRDVYPPAVPTGVEAFAAEGLVTLTWEPNGEADLAGYLVLRGRAGDATLQPLISKPVTDTRYEDRDVTPGVRYVYAVEAVDRRANVSGESNRAEETAR